MKIFTFFISLAFNSMNLSFAFVYESRGPHTVKHEKDFETRCVQLHNIFREKHLTPTVKLDLRLQEYATLAAQAILAKKAVRHPREKASYSWYNMAVKPFPITADYLMWRWYNETRFYLQGDKRSAKRATRMLWRSVRRIGCGIAANRQKVVVLVYYVPPANYKGGYDDNLNLQTNDIDITEF